MKFIMFMSILAALCLGARLEEISLLPERTQEQAVAALPGVGAGWIDTLRMVAGDAEVDTVTSFMSYDDGPGLLGVFEHWHLFVDVQLDLKAYTSFQRHVCASEGFGEYQHPVTLANPPAVLAHEFGHRFELSLWPHGEIHLKGDSIPRYARDISERFADRFSRAMMALRGWDEPDTTDKVLNHVVRTRLRLALAAR